MLAFLQRDIVPEIPLDPWTDRFVDYIQKIPIVDEFFDLVKDAIGGFVGGFEAVMTFPPVLIIGIPLGIISAKSRPIEAAMKPTLDIMQTMPAFVYLVPMVVFLGLGAGPALVATVIFAAPPAVRLTLLGIQQVPQNTVEAAQAFGATPWQTLRKVELPQALPTIMAGVNQVIMLALSMVVIAALVGAGGLGGTVVRGLSQLDVGRAFIGGVGIVIIAIYL